MGALDVAIVIVGASGDLTRRKLMPAFNVLFAKGKLGSASIVVGTGRSFFSDADFRERFSLSEEFKQRVFYFQNFKGLKSYLSSKCPGSRVIFFLSQPPEAYAATAGELAVEGFGDEATLIVEKPYGYDQASAAALSKNLTACFREDQIYRIDHYLGKEAVQNILVFRFANSLFYPIWNSRYIESIQISALEEEGVLERGAYFDKAGTIRDMVQNHLLQLLSLIAMEAPISLSPNDIRDQKILLLKTIKLIDVHRFQYEGYRHEKGVPIDSTTETFAELKLVINNFRWTGVPVYIRTGKAAGRRGTEIGIRLRKLPQLLFNENNEIAPNQIVFKIQPAEGIVVDLSSKVPGTDAMITGTNMNFCYRDSFKTAIPEAYQRLLFDAIKGDRTLFVSAEETDASWNILDGALDRGEPSLYAFGTIPPSKMSVDWIDFEKYASICS